MEQMDRMERKIDKLLTLARSSDLSVYILTLQGRIQIMLGQDILDAVAAETTAVDSVVAYVKGLVDSGVVTAEQGTAILTNINANRAKLEASLVAGVTPPAV